MALTSSVDRRPGPGVNGWYEDYCTSQRVGGTRAWIEAGRWRTFWERVIGKRYERVTELGAHRLFSWSRESKERRDYSLRDVPRLPCSRGTSWGRWGCPPRACARSSTAFRPLSRSWWCRTENKNSLLAWDSGSPFAPIQKWYIPAPTALPPPALAASRQVATIAQ